MPVKTKLIETFQGHLDTALCAAWKCYMKCIVLFKRIKQQTNKCLNRKYNLQLKVQIKMCLFRNIILFRQKGKDGIYKPSVQLPKNVTCIENIMKKTCSGWKFNIILNWIPIQNYSRKCNEGYILQANKIKSIFHV